MSACHRCGADNALAICVFCSTPTPEEQARWMRTEAITFMHRHSGRTQMRIGAGSKHTRMVRSLNDLGVFRFQDYSRTSRVATYGWTEYGRQLLRACVAA